MVQIIEEINFKLIKKLIIKKNENKFKRFTLLKIWATTSFDKILSTVVLSFQYYKNYAWNYILSCEKSYISLFAIAEFFSRWLFYKLRITSSNLI